MEKLRMQSTDTVDENIQRIGKLFPDCLTETKDEHGRTVRAIDFDQLRQDLSKDIVEGPEERYLFTWPDKRNAIRIASTPTTDTLRPCRKESVDFDNTQNLYIEGDNLKVLKLLREDYLGKVKMIYIDPPYNTGNDFVYQDNFTQDAQDYKDHSGQEDEEGNHLVSNPESNGRFHTDWLNMIYPRLKVAKDLMTKDGVIFISIDDHEQKNLKNICDEVFGESNFIAQVVWERAYAPINLMKHFSTSHDYILCYAKNIELAVCNGIPRTDETNERYSNPDKDPRGVWKADNLSVGPAIQSNIFPITTPSGRVVVPPAGRSWRLSQTAFQERLQDNRIWFGSNGDNVPSMKRFLSELRKTGITPMTIWKYSEVGHSQEATQKLAQLFDGKKYFDYPKPVGLIKRCVELYSQKDSIILDFFSGSATTAHTVMQLNAEDGGHRKFIMVQLPEPTDEKSEAYKAGYKSICEIGKERIRRAGQKIVEEQKQKQPDLFEDKKDSLDIGFRVLKLDSSNMQPVYYTPAETSTDTLFDDNIKNDRTDEDLLFQVMIELGIELSAKIEKNEIAGKSVWNVEDGYLLACFDENVDEKTIKEIAKIHPYYFIMRDHSLATDNVADNFEQIFEEYSKDTIRKIL
ncbi:MAG: site-specific DNA-methyltransferase [Prevotella sp.]|jgi:adenine-specific DNA-methyltransferase|nr:site-specific DNA-methyltransferase [Prevotella sp.]MCI1684969.1 site-specific DNA-methyltransferase [Prevotella sp.]MCI1781856.1 site-specific DNA-methyltransferase [Prevotella sp.]MCI1802865.1 site-specific DNA-methyltransferase [Prevotella sp.]MCI1848541.1 site-specific DNA-methyltransferase [Prevotella sp.]